MRLHIATWPFSTGRKGNDQTLQKKHFELALKANPNFQLAIEKLTQLKKEISVRTTP